MFTFFLRVFNFFKYIHFIRFVNNRRLLYFVLGVRKIIISTISYKVYRHRHAFCKNFCIYAGTLASTSLQSRLYMFLEIGLLISHVLVFGLHKEYFVYSGTSFQVMFRL